MKTEIYEDNAGGIHYLHNGKVYFLGFDPAPGQLLADLVSADDWIDDAEVEGDEIGGNDLLIAECDGRKITIYIDAMGNSGKTYAGIED